MSKLILDINDEIERAADDRARGVVIRRLRRALEDKLEATASYSFAARVRPFAEEHAASQFDSFSMALPKWPAKVRFGPRLGGSTMIKDIVLALEVGSSRDPARDYAISVATVFGAHLAAIGFDYAPVLPPVDTVSALPFDILDAEREENRKAASDAIARFEEAARLAAVSAESRLVEATVSGATNVFGSIARTFDLSVVGQPSPTPFVTT